MVDPKLKDYATEIQASYIDAVIEHGGYRKAARALGVAQSTISAAMIGLKNRAARSGYAPEHDMTRTVPAGFAVKGVSTLYREDGSIGAQWVKSTVDRDAREQMIRDFIAAVVDDARGVFEPVEPPEHTSAKLLSVIPMGDPHYGLYAYAEETGDDFDIKIAERVTFAAVDRLVSCSPAADVAILLNLGDYFHADDSKNRTPQSGHALDVDTRFALVAQVGIRAMVRCVRRMLEKHGRVIVRNNPGNHDPHSAFMLSLCLSAFFENEPRVTVDTSPAAYWYYRHGKVLIGSAHGDGAKAADLPLLMAADKPADWGQSQFRHWYCGHIHHYTAKEHPGVTVETFRTLAGKDAWHAAKGYRSGRDMQLIVHHADYGEIERHRCDIARI